MLRWTYQGEIEESWWERERTFDFSSSVPLSGRPAFVREARALYPQLVKLVGFREPGAVEAHLAERVARLHGVSPAATRHRLKEWPLRITQKVERAMRERLTFLE